MEEKRHHKRLELDVSIQLERLDQEGGVTTLKMVHVAVIDMSRGGLGFRAAKELEVGSYYDTTIQIWTKETITAVIEIVRRKQCEDGMYEYGAVFVGMTETDALKIDIYQLFSEEE